MADEAAANIGNVKKPVKPIIVFHITNRLLTRDFRIYPPALHRKAVKGHVNNTVNGYFPISYKMCRCGECVGKLLISGRLDSRGQRIANDVLGDMVGPLSALSLYHTANLLQERKPNSIHSFLFVAHHSTQQLLQL